MNKELAKTLTIALVNYIDENRPEGTLDCSSGECVSLEKAFTEENFNSVETLVNKKLRIPLTPFQQHLSVVLREAHFIVVSEDELNDALIDIIRAHTNDLLAFAKKELFKEWNENMKDEYNRGKKDGLTIGYSEAMKEYNESVAYHFPIMPTPPSGWGCDGTHCTNPHHDCINCPVKYSSGGTITTPNSASGTSTLKAEE